MNDFDNAASDADLERRLALLTQISLESFSNKEIAAFNLAMTGFGSVGEGNCSFASALKFGLINKDGTVLALKETKDATAAVINQRVADGTFI